MDVRTRARQLQEYIAQGRILDAMREFYSPDVAMQENGAPPTVGLEANLERERKFLEGVGKWKGATVNTLAVDGEAALVEYALEFEDTAGNPVRLEQVAAQRWKNGRIVHERFYYNSGA